MAGPGWQGPAPVACGVSVGLWPPLPNAIFPTGAGTAVRAPGQLGSPVSPGLRGDQKGRLLCKVWPWSLGFGLCHGHSPCWDWMHWWGQGCSWLCFLLGSESSRMRPGHQAWPWSLCPMEMHKEMQWKRGKWVCNPNPGCQGVPPRWRSQGTRELGSAAKPWSPRDRARYGGSRDGSCTELEQKVILEAQGEGRAGLWCD